MRVGVCVCSLTSFYSCKKTKKTQTCNLILHLFHSLASVIRGQVLTADGTPLIGVNVSFLHYPDYGYTITRQDGM